MSHHLKMSHRLALSYDGGWVITPRHFKKRENYGSFILHFALLDLLDGPSEIRWFFILYFTRGLVAILPAILPPFRGNVRRGPSGVTWRSTYAILKKKYLYTGSKIRYTISKLLSKYIKNIGIFKNFMVFRITQFMLSLTCHFIDQSEHS